MKTMTIDGKELKAKDILRTWLYGNYFHSKHDSPETKEFKRLGIGKIMHQFNFVQIVIKMSVVAIILANNAKTLLNEQTHN